LRHGRHRVTHRGSPVSEIQQLISSGDKIGAIKAYQAATGCDLATAKKVIDSY
jgi:ribosomal protein L7/L12